MKKIISILAAVFVLVSVNLKTEAKPLLKRFNNPIANAVKESGLPENAMVAVSFKEISSSKPEYQLNATKPMTPASIQKIATMIPSIKTLGENYEFSTKLYKNKNNDLYLQLSADPYFTSRDLKGIVRTLNNYKISTVKAFYIDDSIIDGNEWGEGWEWDDDLNPFMTKFGAYNIDKNVINVSICPTTKGAPADIAVDVFYPTAFINNVVTGDKNDVKLDRKNYISPDVINADGTVAFDMNIEIPVNHPRRYFIFRLEEILRGQKISYYGDFKRLKTPKDLTVIAEVKHPLSQAADDILKRSNNMMAETVFKIAGGKYSKETGSVPAAIEMFKDYYQKEGIKTDDLNIVDGSGVSKDNLVTADFMTEVLVKKAKSQDFETFKGHLATPGAGTLTDRMLYFKDRLWAKTGTLSNISSIAGYIKAKSGKTYAFCIMINDPKSKESDKKTFEEYVLRKAQDEL